MADPVYNSPAAQLLIGLERYLQNKDTITGTVLGNPLFGLRFAGIDTSQQPPSAFPAALITPGDYSRDEQQERVWTVYVTLVTPATAPRTAALALLDLAQQLADGLYEQGETLADGWALDSAWSTGLQLIARGDPNKPTPRDLFYVAVVTLTARRLD